MKTLAFSEFMLYICTRNMNEQGNILNKRARAGRPGGAKSGSFRIMPPDAIRQYLTEQSTFLVPDFETVAIALLSEAMKSGITLNPSVERVQFIPDSVRTLRVVDDEKEVIPLTDEVADR